MKLNIKKYILSVARGEAVDGRFFKNHLFITCFIVISAISVIAARFSHGTAEAKIRSLNQQIEVANTQKLAECSRYHTLTRESAMINLVDSLKLGLVISGDQIRELHLDR